MKNGLCCLHMLEPVTIVECARLSVQGGSGTSWVIVTKDLCNKCVEGVYGGLNLVTLLEVTVWAPGGHLSAPWENWMWNLLIFIKNY